MRARLRDTPLAESGETHRTEVAEGYAVHSGHQRVRGVDMSVELAHRNGSLSQIGAPPLGRQLSTSTIWYATSVIAVGLIYYHWRYEGWRETIIFAGAITAALVCALTFVSRRILFSITLVALLVATIVIASEVSTLHRDGAACLRYCVLPDVLVDAGLPRGQSQIDAAGAFGDDNDYRRPAFRFGVSIAPAFRAASVARCSSSVWL